MQLRVIKLKKKSQFINSVRSKYHMLAQLKKHVLFAMQGTALWVLWRAAVV